MGTEDRFERKLAEFAALKPGWDSYHGEAITSAALDGMRRLLNALSLVPCSDGGVQLEAHTLGWVFEIEVGPDGSVDALVEPRPVGVKE